MSDTFQKASISSDLAHRIIAAAEAKASEIGVPMNIAVCRRIGRAQGLQPDGRRGPAQRPDRTGQGVHRGRLRHVLRWVAREFIKDDPPLAAGAGGSDRPVIFGGEGPPITVGDKVVGAIGVSGGHYTQDMRSPARPGWPSSAEPPHDAARRGAERTTRHRAKAADSSCIQPIRSSRSV